MTGIQNVGYTAGMKGEKFFIPTNESNEQEKKYRLHSIMAQEAGTELDSERELHRCEAIAARIAESIVRLVREDKIFAGITDEKIRELAKIQNELTKLFVFSPPTKDSYPNFETGLRSALENKADNENMRSDYMTYMNHFFHGTGPHWHNAPIEGAKSEAAYISARADELSLWDPETKEPITTAPPSGVFSQLCGNVEIDAFKKVDVTEVHYTKDEDGSPEHITELRLVQVKKSAIDEYEIEQIHQAHQNFIAGMQEYPVSSFDRTQEKVDADQRKSVIRKAADEVSSCLQEGDTINDVLLLLSEYSAIKGDPKQELAFFTMIKAVISSSDKNSDALEDSLVAKITKLRNMNQDKKVKKVEPIKVRIKNATSTIIAEGREVSKRMLDVPHHKDQEGGLQYLP